MSNRFEVLKDFIFFRRMVTPMLAQLLYWAFVVISLVGAMNLYHLHHNALKSLQVAIGGIITARIVCELVMAFFRMDANTKAIRDMMKSD